MKYKKRSADGDDSEYESGSEHYRPKKTLGKGTYAIARLFKASGSRKVVIISPKDGMYSQQEIEAKHDFFKTNYPNDRVVLFKQSDTDKDYRLLVPHIPGQSYKQFYKYRKVRSNPALVIKIFISALDALEECHNKGLTVIDLKEDNVLYNPRTGKTNLIDGGLSKKIGESINTSIFKEKVLWRSKYIQQIRDRLAPECFDTSEVIIATSMDVYALGHLMNFVLIDKDEMVRSICRLCLNKDPKQRPELWGIKLVMKEKMSRATHQDEKNSYAYIYKVIKALQKLHEQGIAMVSFFSENIRINEEGVLALKMFPPFENLELKRKGGFAFKDPTEEALEYYRTTYYQFAPECWSTSGALATCAMDVYSLGVMFKGLFSAEGTDRAIIQLLDACTDPNPTNRPDISNLKNKLNIMQRDIESEKRNSTLKI